ncbi:MAG: DUF5711 family protein [Clostridia bacterium]|nr:DUF5711 family protein [Clostridia bacterium]MDD4387199.1 DUF5711 family protein [Clostridia bacterium]
MRKKINISVNKRIIENIKKGAENNMNKGIHILNDYKEKKNEERNKRIYPDKEENSQGHTIKLKPIIISFIVIIIFFITYILLEYAPILGINIFNNKSQENIIIENLSQEKNIYKEYNNELLVYSNQFLITYNTNGKKTWEYKIDKNISSDIYINGSYMVIANKSNGNIYIFSGKNELTNKKIDGDIDNVYLDEKGNVAIEYSSSGYKKIITVFNKYGENKYSAYISSSSILDIKLIDDAKKLLLVQTDSSSLTIGTKISIIDMDKTESIKEILKLENKLIYDLKIINDDVILVTNDNIEKYNLNTGVNTEIHSLDANQTNYITLSDNYFTAIETTKTKFSFITNKFDNTSISNIELDVLPKYIKNSGLLTYIVSENSILVVNKWGIIVRNIDIKLPPKDIVIFNKEKSLALIYSNRIEIIKL